MKKILFTLILVIASIASIYAQKIDFQESGISFSISIYGTLTYTIPAGKQVFNNSSGNPTKIGDVNIFYGYDGKPSKVGTLDIFYSGGKVSKVGGMSIFYDGSGNVSQTIGAVGGSSAASSGGGGFVQTPSKTTNSIYISDVTFEDTDVKSNSQGVQSSKTDAQIRSEAIRHELQIEQYKREDEEKRRKEKQIEEEKRRGEETQRRIQQEKAARIKQLYDRYARVKNKNVQIPIGWHRVLIEADGEVYKGFVLSCYNDTYSYYTENLKVQEKVLPQGKISNGVGYFKRLHSEVWKNVNVIEKIYTGKIIYKVFFLEFLENPTNHEDINPFLGRRGFVFNTDSKEVIKNKYFYMIFAKDKNTDTYCYAGEASGFSREELRKSSHKTSSSALLSTNAETLDVLIVLVKITKKGNIIQYALPIRRYNKNSETFVKIKFSKEYPN